MPMGARGPPLALKLRTPSRPRARLWRRSARPIPPTSPWKLIDTRDPYRPGPAPGLRSESATGAHSREGRDRIEVVEDGLRAHLELEQRVGARAKFFQGSRRG